MSPRTVVAEPEAWNLVANAVIRRRTELDLRAQDVVAAARGGISTSVLSLIENAKQTSYARRTLAALCRALQWTPDSIERLLDGKYPEVSEAADPRTEANLPARRSISVDDIDDLDDRLAALERRVAALEAKG